MSVFNTDNSFMQSLVLVRLKEDIRTSVYIAPFPTGVY